jgi:hypothetical protein
MENANLILNMGSGLSVGDIFEIVHSDGSITGTFYGLADGDTFTSGNYELKIAYDYSENGSSIYLEIMGIIPEPSTLAALFGLAALALAAVQRRKN